MPSTSNLKLRRQVFSVPPLAFDAVVDTVGGVLGVAGPVAGAFGTPLMLPRPPLKFPREAPR